MKCPRPPPRPRALSSPLLAFPRIGLPFHNYFEIKNDDIKYLPPLEEWTKMSWGKNGERGREQRREEERKREAGGQGNVCGLFQ